MDDLHTAAARLEALGSPVRLAIYRMLVRAGADGRAVGAINQQMDMAPSTLSHHLKALESVGLVQRRKDGTTHFCSANYDAMDGLITFLSEECCADAPGPGAAGL